MAAEGRETEARKKRKAPQTETKSKQKEKEKEKEKPAKTTKPRNEIDDIFDELQRKKNRNSKIVADQEQTKNKKAKEKKGGMDERSEIRVSPFSKSGDRERKRPRRKTGDGLPIYSAEELGVSNPDAGGTPLCPFDCSCCF